MGEKELVLASPSLLPVLPEEQTTNLVRDNGREKALKKIVLFKQQNEKKILEKTIEERNWLWARYFLELAQGFFTITSHQMKELDDDDLKYLDELTAKTARRWHRITQAYFCVPIIGWIGYMVAHANEAKNTYGEALRSWHYIRGRERLKRHFEKKYFPVDAVRKRLLSN